MEDELNPPLHLHPYLLLHKKCTKRQSKIGFLKMHKCGGTTIQNLLFRNAMARELNVALPRMGIYMESPTRAAMAGTPWVAKEMQLFALHTRCVSPPTLSRYEVQFYVLPHEVGPR